MAVFAFAGTTFLNAQTAPDQEEFVVVKVPRSLLQKNSQTAQDQEEFVVVGEAPKEEAAPVAPQRRRLRRESPREAPKEVAAPVAPVVEEAVYNGFMTVEGFYAAANNKIDKDIDKKLNIGGLWMTAGRKFELDPTLSFDLAGIFAVGGGFYNEKRPTNEERYIQADGLLGIQPSLTVNLGDHFSLSGGLMAGLDVRSMRYRYSGYIGWQHRIVNDTDTRCGAFYGSFLKADVKFTKRFSLTASARYMGTTVQNEFEVAGVSWQTEKTNYAVVTVGFKFAF